MKSRNTAQSYHSDFIASVVCLWMLRILWC